jgi:hypothetical protein
MKYFIKARWWRNCVAMDTMTQNLVIGESPMDWLIRQNTRLLGTHYTNIQIDSCCQVSEDAMVYSDPDFSK